MDDKDKIEEMQALLRKEILEKGYDKTRFINYCLSKREDGDILYNWTLEELKTIVSSFQSLENKQNDIEDNSNEENLPKEIYEEKENIEEIEKDEKKYILKILIQQTGYLDKKNLYLVFYFRNENGKIKYQKSCPYEINLKIFEKDFSKIYNSSINICIYEAGILKDKFIGDFNIKLLDLKIKKEFSQKCEINESREKKRKGLYVIALVQLKSNHPNEKSFNNNNQTSKKAININNNKDENKNLIKELNEEISNLKNILDEKEKIIAEEKKKNQMLNDKLLEIQNLLEEKEKIIAEEKKKNQKLNENIIALQNILKVKEETLNEEKKKLEESNKILNNYKNVMGCSSKDEKIMKLLDDVELKEKEIKQLNKMKSRLPFELLENEKLMSIIMVSNDQKIHYSIICKNSQKFTKIEENLYERYPEYIESENFFLVNGNKINKYKSLEENKIKNSDIITLFKYDEM